MSAVPSVSSSQYYGVTAAAPKSQLDMKSFLTLLTQQMTHQDPTQPMSNSDFFAQVAQLGQVQGMDKLNSASEIQQIQNMMGKQVTAVQPMTQSTTGRDNLVTGIATSLVIKDGVRYVSLRQTDGSDVQVQLSSVQSVQNAPQATDYTNLVGRAVTGPDSSGKVAAIKVSNGEIVLSVESNGHLTDLPLSNVTSIGS